MSSFYDYKIWKDAGVRVFVDRNSKDEDEQKLVDAVGMVEDAVDELRELGIVKIEIYNSENNNTCEVDLKKLFPKDGVKATAAALNI